MIGRFINNLARDRRLTATLLLLAACAALFAALRARFVPHLLAWDEAMNLCTVRSFVAQGTDEFSGWFWRHPPLYCLMMALCSPFESGFAERVQAMTIGLGVINLVILFLLNRKILGRPAALWSCFFLAVMPGAMFFDVWVKRDHGVTTFALLALLALFSRRPWLAGLAMGAAFLFKATAAFYFIGAIAIATIALGRRDAMKQLAILIGVPALMAGWWYVMFGATNVLLKYSAEAEDFWHQPWHTYFTELKLELGWGGLALAAMGVIAAASRLRRARRPRRIIIQARRYWPLFVLLPAYAGLSILPNKTAWIVIVLFPAWATLAGIGMAGLMAAIERLAQSHRRKPPGEAAPPRNLAAAGIQAIAAIAVMTAALAGALRIQYDDYFEALLPDHWGASVLAKDIVDYANQNLKDGDRVLLTNFHFWGGVERAQPCAVFTYYLEPNVQVLMRPHDITGEALFNDVMQYRIDWAIVSPEPGPPLQTMHRDFHARAGLMPAELQKAVVYDTRPLHGGSTAATTPPP